jgi:hypothetical protein
MLFATTSKVYRISIRITAEIIPLWGGGLLCLFCRSIELEGNTSNCLQADLYFRAGEHCPCEETWTGSQTDVFNNSEVSNIVV